MESQSNNDVGALSVDRPLTLSDSDFSLPNLPDQAILLEDASPFFHYSPVIVALADQLTHPLSTAWNSARHTHSTYFCEVEDALIFGPNFVGGLRTGRCHSETLQFRRGAYEFFDNTIRQFYPGCHPDVEFPTPNSATITWTPDALPNVQSIAEPVIALTPFEPDNWGRWICHVLPRVHYARQKEPQVRLLIRAAKGWQIALLRQLGIEEGRYICHDPGLSIRAPRVFFFQQSSVDFTVSPLERRYFKALAERTARGHAVTPRRIFLSRRSVSAANPEYRRLINEDELTVALEKVGFATVEPELLPFESQVAWFLGAEIVVTVGGSGLFNCVFCKPSAKVLTIESKTTFVTSHTGFLASLGLWHGLIFGRPQDTTAAAIHSNWEVDTLATVKSIMRALGS